MLYGLLSWDTVLDCGFQREVIDSGIFSINGVLLVEFIEGCVVQFRNGTSDI
jgi:hypothetical protein